MEFLGIGDLHLPDSNGVGGLAKYIEDPATFVIQEVQKIMDYGRSKGVFTIIFYGDLFENPRGSYEGHLALIGLFRSNPKFRFIAIPGNHDKFGLQTSAGHSLQILEAMKIPNFVLYTEPTVIDLDGARVHMMPWPCKAFRKDCLNVAHIEVKGSQLDSGRKLDSDDLVKTSAVACVGHLHTPHQVKNVHYSGTIYQTNFGEGIKKYFHHVRFNDVDDYEIELIPHRPKYRLYTVIVHSKADLEGVSRKPNDLIKLVIEDGADIEANDYQWPNVVQVKAYKSKAELTAILTEDLVSGEELVIKSSDFFNEWISVQDITPELKSQAKKLRTKILRGTRT